MAFWSKKAPTEASEEATAARQRWVDQLTTIQVRTLRTDRAPRPTQGLSVRQKLVELSEMYQEFLDERVGRLSDAEALVSRSWTGGLQSYLLAADRAASLMRHLDSADGVELGRMICGRDREVLDRIVKVSQGLARGFQQRALEVDPDANLASLRSGATVPDVKTTLGIDATGGPVPVQQLAALFDVRSASAQVDKAAWQQHYTHNSTWNNEVLTGHADATLHVPTDLLPEDMKSRKTLPPLVLDDATQKLLDMALDLGVDHVVIQSTVTLTGDVTNIISPHLPPEEQSLLLELHTRGLSNALKHWSDLLGALAAFLTSLFDALFKSKRK